MGKLGAFGPGFVGPVAPSIPPEIAKRPEMRWARSVDLANLGRLTPAQLNALVQIANDYRRKFPTQRYATARFALRGLGAFSPARYVSSVPAAILGSAPGGGGGGGGSYAAWFARSVGNVGGGSSGGGGAVSEE